MSENDNGAPPPSDPNEVKTTIGMPVPARTDDDAEQPPSSDLEAAPAEVIEADDQQDEDTHFAWPVDPEHANAIGTLSEQLVGVEVDFAGFQHKKPSRALNFILLVAVIATTAVGMNLLAFYSSPDRAARLTEKVMCEAELDVLQKRAAGERQRGTLNIDSAPNQAKVFQYDDKAGSFLPVPAKTAEGEAMDALTPATISNLDINQTYRFKLTFTDTLKRQKELSDEEKKELKEGEKPPIEEMPVQYRDEEITVARYQWIQDGATGTFRFQKIVSLTPDYVEYYHAFDWKSGKAERFETLEECKEFRQKDKTDASICRAIPRAENWEKRDARIEAEEKASKKRGRKRRRRR